MLKNMVLKTSIWELQKALYARISGDPDIQEKVIGGVHDSIVPSATLWHNEGDTSTETAPKLPYIVLGEDTVGDYSTKTEQGEDITHTLQVFSNYAGKKEVKEILNLILVAISKEPIALDGGFEVDDIRRDYMEAVEDQGFYRGILRLRFKITQV